MIATITLSHVLHDRWWIGLLAFVASIVTTPILRAVAYRTRIVDRPDDQLKPHGRPVAYLGGVAMWLGLLAGLAGYISEMPELGRIWADLRTCLLSLRLSALLDNPLWNVFSIAAASTLITAIGLADDLVRFRPGKKVCGQVAAGLLLVVGGVGDRMVQVVLTPLHLSLPEFLIMPLSMAMCLVVVVAACNATNLLDGLDGLCGGVTGIIALGFLALAAWLAMWAAFPATDGLRIALCLAMVGAVLGFLPYNIPPASIFMGDAGSMLLGFFVATMMALFCQEGNARWFLAACVIFALPILDTALAVARRALAGASIFAGDRSHLYDQLVDRGMTVKQVVVLFYGLAVLADALGVTVAIYMQGRYALLLYGLVLAAIWLLFWKKGMINPPAHQGLGPKLPGP
jgi:UDP-GlcNAc:undecaprenyl-phosphate GlcNAc-1-phosphate transferase